jgi:hypothetical protein
MPYYKGISRIGGGGYRDAPDPPKPPPKPSNYTRWIIAAVLALILIGVVIYYVRSRRSHAVAYRYAT